AMFAAGRADVRTAVQKLSPAGHTTELFYGIWRGLEQFEVAGLPSRKVLVVISDGKNEGKAYTLDDCIRRANTLGVDIFGIGITSGDSRDLLNITRLAEMTGGASVRIDREQSWSDK